MDGPCTGVKRQARRYTELHLTTLVTKISRGCSERAVRIAWEADKISDKWNATSWARRIEKRVKVHLMLVLFDVFYLNSSSTQSVSLTQSY